ncbi:MAG: Y-family DNA polymerase [Gammaproteobacteria bacterium]|nr:Y-family DNA polymerase [Gammaproteobacteria bacterium]
MFALIDCNNFYASCERLFRPDLRNKPLIVLSNNDGCVIARSNEAKKLGIAMGEPYFKIKYVCKQHDITVFSSNFALYGDLSHRVMSIIDDAWPHVEVYSIDEAFLDLSELSAESRTSFCWSLQKQLLKETGIPTSVGIGKTKTLAKVANYIAKTQLKTPVFNIDILPQWLDSVPIHAVWGVGKQWTRQLLSMNIQTAGDLARADSALIRQRCNVSLQRTSHELRGRPCLELNDSPVRQSIVSSKSFGSLQTELTALNEAVSSHMARAWEKLRQQQLLAQHVSVFVHSNRFRPDLPSYSNTIGLKLMTPTDDIRLLTQHAKLGLQQIFKAQIHYKKVGIMLDGLTSKQEQQLDLFHAVEDTSNGPTEKFMSVIEGINGRFGQGTVKLAAEGTVKPWTGQNQMKSPSYTTQWGELPLVRVW